MTQFTELPKHWTPEIEKAFNKPAYLHNGKHDMFDCLNALLASSKARIGAQCKPCQDAGMRNCSDFVNCSEAKKILIIDLE